MLAALAYTWVLNTLCPQYSIIHFISYILRDVPGMLSLVSSFLQAIYTSFCMPLICLLTVTQSGINLHKAVSTCEVEQRTCLQYPHIKDKILVEETGSTQ